MTQENKGPPASSNTTVWERKGNLTGQPATNPIPPVANIGGSGSGKVPATGTGSSPSSSSTSGDSSGKQPTG